MAKKFFLLTLVFCTVFGQLAPALAITATEGVEITNTETVVDFTISEPEETTVPAPDSLTNEPFTTAETPLDSKEAEPVFDGEIISTDVVISQEQSLALSENQEIVNTETIQNTDETIDTFTEEPVSFFETVQETFTNFVTTIEEIAETITTPVVEFFTGEGKFPETIDDSLFQIQDESTDIAYLNDGKSVARIYAQPRNLMYDDFGKQVVDPGTSNWFEDRGETQLTVSTVGGYTYQVPLGDTLITVQGGTQQIGSTTHMPQLVQPVVVEKGEVLQTEYSEIYPGVKVYFRDAHNQRERRIELEKIPTGLTSGGSVIFWEEYQLPVGAVVVDQNDVTLDGTTRMKENTVRIRTQNQGVFSIGSSVVFDARQEDTTEALQFSSLVPVEQIVEVDYQNGIARIGLELSAEYLLDAERKYPVTIDPTYYACLENGPVDGSLACAINDFYFADGTTFNTNDLYMGLWRNGAQNVHREIALYFSTNFQTLPGVVQGAILKMRYWNEGFGNADRMDTEARRIDPAFNWDRNNIGLYDYDDFRGRLLSENNPTAINDVINPNPAIDWISWDVLNSVRAWEGGATNRGLVVEQDPAWPAGAVPPASWENQLIKLYASNEAGANSPYLELNLQAQLADLITRNGVVNDITVDPGQGINVNVDVHNNGPAAAAASTLGYYLSTNSTWDAGDTRLGTDPVVNLANGVTSAENEPLVIPANWQNFGFNYILFVADHVGVVQEPNELNNVTNVRITVNQPPAPLSDLVLQNPAVDNASVARGAGTTARIRSRNSGAVAVPVISRVGYYLSTNNTYSVDDVFLSDDAVNALAVDAAEDDSDLVTIPADWNNLGQNYIIFRADYQNVVAESNEANNVASVPITITTVVDPLEPNNSLQAASWIGVLGQYNNNQASLTAGDEDWYRFQYGGRDYFIKVRGIAANTAGEYNLSLSVNNDQLTAETSQRTVEVDTFLVLYDAGGNQLRSDDDSGAGLFSFFTYNLPPGGYCGGQCGGAGDPPPSNGLPDQDADTFADVEEAYGGTPIQNPNQRADLYNSSNQLYYAKVADKVAGNYGADPVNLRTGSFELTEHDFRLSGRGVPIDFVRTYNSLTTEKDSRLGNGWDFSQNIFYYQDPVTGNIQVYRGGSLLSSFTSADGGATFVAEKGNSDTLFWENGAVVYRTLEGVRYEFTNRLTSQLGILERIRDTNNNVTEFTYIVRRDVPLLSQIRDASGRVVEFTYGAEDGTNWQRITSLRERANPNQAEQRLIVYTYDAAGNLTRMRDNRSFEGATESIEKNYMYDGSNRMIRYTDPRGTILYNEYDASGRVINQREYNPRVDAVGNSRLVWSLAYAGGRGDAPGSTACTTVTYRRSAAVSYDEVSCFNADGLKVFFQDGSGASEKWTYDNNGMPQTYQDKNGNITSYTHDARRRVTLEVLPATTWYTERTFTYENNFNRLIRATEQYRPANNPAAPLQFRVKQFLYDANANLTEVRDFLGNSEFFVYDQFGNVTRFTNKNGYHTNFVYDANGNYKIREEQLGVQVLGGGDVQNIIKRYQYDPYGQVTVYTDPAGGNWQSAYDTRGNLRRTTNPQGGVQQFRYDLEDNRIQEIDERSFITNYVYDTDIEDSLLSVEQVGQNGDESIITRYSRDYLGNLVQETSPRGDASVVYTYTGAGQVAQKQTPHNTTLYTYDAAGNLVRERNSLNQETLYQYDARHQRVRTESQSAAGAVVTRTVYDAFSRPTAVIDPRGNTTTYVYDSMDRLLEVIDFYSNTTSYTYDRMGNKKSVLLPRAQGEGALRNARNHSISYDYDDINRPIRTINADNKESLSIYDTRGNLVRVIDRQNADGTDNSRTVNFAYDSLNRKISETRAEGGVVRFEYDLSGNLTRQIDPLNRVTTFGYDSFGRQKTMTDPGGQQTVYTYDLSSNRVGIRYPDNTETSFAYDASERLTRTTDALGNFEATTYDAVDNVITRRNKRGEVTTFVYDASNRLVRETNPQNTVTTYTYDLIGNKITQSVDGQTTAFGYDDMSRLIRVTHPGNSTELYVHDNEGHVISFTDGKNQTTSYTYDAVGRLVQKTPASNEWVSYQYNNWDLPTQITENDSFTRSFTYDRENRVTLESQLFNTPAGPINKQIRRAYNVAGELTTLTDPANRAFDYTYSNRGLLARVDFGGTAVASYTYNAFGAPSVVTFGNGVRTSYGYDSVHRLNDMHVQGSANQTLLRQQYEYDAESNRTELAETFINEAGESANRTVRYAYDNIDQITAVNYTDRGVGNDLTFAYDAKGNRISATAPFGSVSYGYNAAGQLTGVNQNTRLAVASVYDQNGSLTQEVYRRQGVPVQEVNYSWDADNRLAGITYIDRARPDYLPDLAQNTLSFVYDNDGNRIKKQANSEVTYYVNNGLAVLSELDGQNLSVTKTLIPGVGTAAELNAAGELSYVHADVLGSTVLTTNQAGMVTSEYDYDVFGALLGMKGSTQTGYLFTGQEFDGESNLYYYNARYYSPTLGRFIARDVYLGEAGDALSRNRYIYVQNNPLKFVDPTGNEKKKKEEDITSFFLQTLAKIGFEYDDLVADEGTFRGWGAKIFHGAVNDRYLGLLTSDDLDNIPDSFYDELGNNPNIVEKFYDDFRIGGKFNIKGLYPNRNSKFLSQAEMAEIAKKTGFSEKSLFDTEPYGIAGLKDVVIGDHEFRNDIPGNILYGYAAAAGGLDKDFILMLAGLGNKQEWLQGKYKNKENRTFFGGGVKSEVYNTFPESYTWNNSYFDDPNDQKAIKVGYDLWQQYPAQTPSGEVLNSMFASLSCQSIACFD